MIRTMMISAAMAVSMTLSACGQESGPAVNAPAPAFSGVTSDGATLSLADLAGKAVVLEWTNHECPFVVRHYGAGTMQATQAAAKAVDAIWVSVISSAPGKQGHVSAEKANDLTKDRGAAPDYVILDESGAIGRAYAAKTTPHMFVIDRDGVLAYDGAIDDKPTANAAEADGAINYVTAALGSVTAGAAVDMSKTKPYGCSVKYDS